MSFWFLALLAGMLSVLAPCVLPVLPIILGSSLWAQKWYRPLIIVVSTWFFITFFTVILKVSSILIWVPQMFWVSFSAVIIIVYGVTLLWPELWEKVAMSLGITNANNLATKAKSRQGVWGDILLGAALGPIFASCSPTYALLLSIIFPKSFSLWVVYTLIYSLGFALLLLVIAYGGRAVVQKLNWAANPRGRFKRTLGIILIITWLLIATGLMQTVQTRILEDEKRDLTKIEQRLIEKIDFGSKDKACFTSSSWEYSCSWSAVQMWASGAVNDKDPRSKLLNANYKAPEFAWLENWINTSWRNSIGDLKWKVVVVDFWTYSCINCIRTLPYLRDLYKTYEKDGLVIIGVHAPEFQFEHDIANVRNAVEKFWLLYPVVQDNNFKTWRNYNNLYWPAKYIIDRQWNVRYTHFGEGKYEETEQVIQYLLGVDAAGVIHDDGKWVTAQQTPETYLGENRRAHFSKEPTDALHSWWLEGNRLTEDERIMLLAWEGSITINAYAKEVNLVLWTDTETVPADVYIDGVKTKHMIIDSYQLYNLMKNESAGQHKVEIRFLEPWIMAYAYTFG